MRLLCYHCGNEFEKADKEIRRQQRAGCTHFSIAFHRLEHNTPNDGLKPFQRRTRKIDELLGEKFSTAKSKLNKLLMFELAKKCNMDICFRCSEIIVTIEEFTIDHKESWLLSDESAKLVYDINNIAFSHVKCNYEAGTKTDVNNCKGMIKEDHTL